VWLQASGFGAGSQQEQRRLSLARRRHSVSGFIQEDMEIENKAAPIGAPWTDLLKAPAAGVRSLDLPSSGAVSTKIRRARRGGRRRRHASGDTNVSGWMTCFIEGGASGRIACAGDRLWRCAGWNQRYWLTAH